jgi:hypothetical protein
LIEVPERTSDWTFVMSRITCKDAAQKVILQHGFEGLTAESFNPNLDAVGEYMGNEVENACFAYVRQLSDEEKFWVWYTCDDSLLWQEGICFYGTESEKKSEWLEGLSGWALHLTIKAQA